MGRTKLAKILFERGIHDVELMDALNELGFKTNKARICNIKGGKSDFLIYGTLVPMCKALNVTPNDLIEGDW